MASRMEYKMAISLSWVSRVLEGPHNEWRVLIKEALERKEITAQLIGVLTCPAIYHSLYTHIQSLPLSSSQKQKREGGEGVDNSFWPIIRSLAHNGVYLEDPQSDGSCLSHSRLASIAPFNQSLHCVLMEGFMLFYSLQLAPIGRIVKSVRLISGLTASKELPTSLDEGLLLWMNKTSKTLHKQLDEEQEQSILMEPDPNRRRLARLRTLREKRSKGFPKATDFGDSLRDGQCLAAVLLYHYRDRLSISDFVLNHGTLTQDECLINLNKIKSFCDSQFSPPSLHMTPTQWVEHTPGENLKGNVLAFVSFLFHSLSSLQLKKTIRAVPQVGMISNPTYTSTPLRKHRREMNKSREMYRPIVVDVSSISTASLPSQCTACRGRSWCNCKSVSLVDGGSSAVELFSPLRSEGMKFSGAVRDSSSVSQTTLLSSFNSNSTRGVTLSPSNHSNRLKLHSSPLKKPKKSLITPSLENLGITLPSTKRPREASSVVESSPTRAVFPNTKCIAGLKQSPSKDWDSKTLVADDGITDETGKAGFLDRTLTLSPRSDAGVEPQSEIPEHDRFSEDEDDKSPTSSEPPMEAVNDGLLVEKGCEQISDQEPVLMETFPRITQPPVGEMNLKTSEDASPPLTQPHTISHNGTSHSPYKEVDTVNGTDAAISPNLYSPQVVAANVSTSHSDAQLPPPEPSVQSHNISSHSTSTTCSPPNPVFIPPLSFPSSPPPSQASAKDGIRVEWSQVRDTSSPPQRICSSIPPLSSPPFHQPSPSPPPSHSLAKEEYKVERCRLHEKEKGNDEECPPCYAVTVHIRFDYFNDIKDWTLKPKLQKLVQELRESMKRKKEPKNEEMPEKNLKKAPQETEATFVDTTQVKASCSGSLIEDQGKVEEEEERRKRKEELVKARLAKRDRKRKERKEKEKNVNQDMEPSRSSKDSCEYCAPSAVPSSTLLQPHLRSNIKLVKNALCHICLAGDANIISKKKALNELETSNAGHYMILFRDSLSLKFKGLYGYSPKHQYERLFGVGPRVVKESMLETLFKYNSGTKSFQSVPSHTFSLSVDAFTIQDHLWTAGRKRASLFPR